jgi:deoxycytidine triphosphate deaminase
MILPGRIAYSRGILANLRCTKTQVQPCGIDLSLKHILRLHSAGCVDFDNSHRKTAASAIIPFETNASPSKQTSPFLHLDRGVYLVEFNETIRTPHDIMGQLFVRSSVFRSGAHIHAGVMDSGYEGVIGAMLTVENDAGFRVYKDARLAQMVFQELTEPTEAYSGQYQGSAKL